MARDHSEQKINAPQVVEVEVTLSLLNNKINYLTNLVTALASKLGAKVEEEE